MPLAGGRISCGAHIAGSSDARVRVLSVFGAVCMGLNLPIPMTRAMVDCRTCQKTYDVPIDGKGT